MKDFLIIIPARGGSKEIPNKNLRIIGGKPLVAYSIEHAIENNFDNTQIVVSSDSDEILDVAKQYSIMPLKRPQEISGDSSPTEDALIHACQQYSSFKHVITLQPTSPIRSKNLLNNVTLFYIDGKYDSVLTGSKFYDFFWFKDKDGFYSSYDYKERPMRQNMTDFRYFDNGNVYISNIEMLLKTKCRLGDNVGVYEISSFEGLQVDTINELNFIKEYYDNKNSTKGGS